MSIRESLCSVFGKRVLFQEPLAGHLAYGVGGPADYLVFPTNLSELEKLNSIAKQYRLPITIIGNGTNLLVLDGGIRGITISLTHAFKNIELLSDNTKEIHVRVGGGVGKKDLLDWAVERGFSKLEFSAGIPGTIGGGIYMNAGTKYGCYADILSRLCLFDFNTGSRILTRDEAHFGYREQTAIKDSLVAWVEFALSKGDVDEMRQLVGRIITERAEKQPLDYPSCGSTFKNPEGYSAGRLIERAGLKGAVLGGAEISDKHANFILNKRNAKATDILGLIQYAKESVLQKFGVQLECEVVILGETVAPA